MLFAFSEDQQAIAQAARAMLIETCTPADLRRLLESSAPRDEARWRTICEMGLLGILAPEDRGGLGLGMVDFIGIAEAAGYVALPEPLVELAGIAIPLLAASDSDLLDTALGGNTVAVGHPANRFVADADAAIALLLGHGDAVYSLERIDAKLERYQSVDPFRRLFSVDWQPSAGTRLAAGWGDTADRGALLAAAQLIGLGQRCIDMSVAYAQGRLQFGRPIGANQAVKHLLANAQVAVEFARPVVLAAAAELPLGTLAARARVAHAKIAAGRAADLAARTAVQVHGAMGMTWEADVHFFLKRVLALRHAWGGEAVHGATVATRLENVPVGPDSTFAAELALRDGQ